VAVPRPEPGLVVHFDYLWSGDAADGREEGRYPRPCAIVLSSRMEEGETFVVLMPITHSPPRDGQAAIEIPPRVKAHLGLDSERSWIVIDEVNQTGWPGFDLRPTPDGRDAYGFIPPRLFEQILAGVRRLARSRAVRVVKR